MATGIGENHRWSSTLATGDEYEDLAGANDGTNTGTTVVSDTGAGGLEAFNLSGSGQYFDVGDLAYWDGVNTTLGGSVWVKTDDTTTNKCIFAAYPTATRLFYVAKLAANTVRVVFGAGNGSNDLVFWTTDSAQLTSTGTWYHIAWNADVSGSGTATIYIDGSSVAATKSTLGTPPTTLVDTSQTFKVGRLEQVTSWDWDGRIDDLLLFPSLTSGNVTTLNDSGNGRGFEPAATGTPSNLTLLGVS